MFDGSEGGPYRGFIIKPLFGRHRLKLFFHDGISAVVIERYNFVTIEFHAYDRSI